MRKRIEAERAWYHSDFTEDLNGLQDDLVQLETYIEATRNGRDAVPDGGDDAGAENIADIWVGHVGHYAKQVQHGLAEEIADKLNNETTPDMSADQILDVLNGKLSALESSITRYADPPHGAGQNSYGEGLSANDVLLVWQLEPIADHCDDCLSLASGGPYQRDTIPTWPGMGDTQCLDRCKCTITADPDSWEKAFAQEES